MEDSQKVCECGQYNQMMCEMFPKEFYYEKEIHILTSRCDSNGCLGIADSVDLFMDIATEHQEKLGSGVTELARQNKFWVTAKTRVDFIHHPKLLDRVTLSTWISKPKAIYGDRQYCIKKDGEPMVVGKTQWTIIDVNSGRPDNVSGIYPEGTAFPEDAAIDEPFIRVTGEMTWEPFAEYTVRSTDIDIGHHMNNVAYIRAFQSLFSVKEWNEMNLHSIEIQYKLPCFEGDILSFSRCKQNEKTFYKAHTGDKLHTLIIVQ